MQNFMEIRQRNLELLSSHRFRSGHPSIVTKFFVTSLWRHLSSNFAKNKYSNLFYQDQLPFTILSKSNEGIWSY